MARNYNENDPKNATKIIARNPFIWIIPAFIGLTALLSPSDVLERLPALNTWCADLVQRYPFLNRLARRSTFPQVTQLVVCMTAVLIWIHALIAAFVIWQARSRFLIRAKVNDFSANAAFLLGIALLILVLYGLFFGDGGVPRCKTCLTHVRWVFSLFYAAGIWLVGAALGLIPIAIYVHIKK